MGKLVNSVLDLAERMANRHIPMTMEDWANVLILFLKLEVMPYYMMQERFLLNLPRALQSRSLKSTV